MTMTYRFFSNIDNGIDLPYTHETNIYAEDDDDAIEKARTLVRKGYMSIGHSWLMISGHQIDLVLGERIS